MTVHLYNPINLLYVVRKHIQLTRKMLLIAVLPFVILSFLDSFSTYLGVCVYGGYEMNSYAVAMATKYGFLGYNSIFILIWSGLGYLFGVILQFLEKRKNILIMICIGCIFTMAILSYINIILFNFNSLYSAMTGQSIIPTPERLVDIPNDIKQSYEYFQIPKHRQDFCRLL